MSCTAHNTGCDSQYRLCDARPKEAENQQFTCVGIRRYETDLRIHLLLFTTFLVLADAATRLQLCIDTRLRFLRDGMHGDGRKGSKVSLVRLTVFEPDHSPTKDEACKVVIQQDACGQSSKSTAYVEDMYKCPWPTSWRSPRTSATAG